MFTNIPEGVSYEVEETQANGYDAPAYKVNTKKVIQERSLVEKQTKQLSQTTKEYRSIQVYL